MTTLLASQEIENTIKLLRFPFSVFLLPITLFSFYYVRPDADLNMILTLTIWHLLVYPASNGYNSYHDKDEGPIGGLENPPVPEKILFNACNIMDALALMLSLYINVAFTFFVFIYILTSRLYSNRKIRLKKYPLLGFLTVTIFQGAWIFAGNFFAFGKEHLLLDPNVVYSMIACSGFIGCIYPLTQIYQHEADKKDNVKTLSILLGEKGTFVFSGLMFSIAAFFLYLSFTDTSQNKNFLMFNLVMLPSLIYFLWWTKASFKDRTMINFKNTMRMLILSSILNNIYFLILLLK